MVHNRQCRIGQIPIGPGQPFLLILGPCVLETIEGALLIAKEAKEIGQRHSLPVIFKASFDKANRSSGKSFRGPGLTLGLKMLAEIKKQTGLPITTDVHECHQAEEAGEVLDLIQIPAFLARQTDLVLTAAKTGKAVNIKKGQFLAPWDMKNVVAKITGAGNPNVLVTDRGTSFGYNTLITDFRGLPIMAKETGKPIVFDATHSVQQPGGQGASSGGQREFVPVLARAAISVGVASVFIETHENPAAAFSDGPNMVPLAQMESLLSVLKAFDSLAKSHPVSI